MIRRAWNWLALVLPEPAWLFMAFFGVVVVEAFYLWMRRYGLPEQILVAREVRHATIAGVAALYGVFRASAFSPALRPKYRAWLALTPWRLGQPLPLGPIWPTLQDAVVLLFLQLLAYDAPLERRALIVSGFLAAWSLVAAMGAFETGERWRSGLVGVLLGVVILAGRLGEWTRLGVAIAMTAVAIAALMEAFRRFPWSDARFPLWGFVRSSTPQNSSSAAAGAGSPNGNANRLEAALYSAARFSAGSTKSLGWPHDLLGPMTEDDWPARDFVSASLLLGWWYFCLGSLLHQEALSVSWLFTGGSLAIGLAVTRLSAYYAHYQPPISPLGRLLTFRWIIPRYDLAALGPAAIMACATLPLQIDTFFPQQSIWIPATTRAAAVAAMLLAKRFFPPSLDRFRHTSPCRLSPRMYKLKPLEFVEG